MCDRRAAGIRAVAVMVTGTVLSGALAACGTAVDRADPGAPTASGATAGTPSAAVPPPSEGADPAVRREPPDLTERLVGRTIAGLGRVVTDEDGWILYRFDGDSADPPTTACYADCAQAWPPALTNGKPALTGVKKSLVGSIGREGGGRQLTIGGWPVYRYSGDTRPGEWRGQAAGGKWFVVAPSGRKNTTRPAGGAPGAGLPPAGGGSGTPAAPDPGGY